MKTKGIEFKMLAERWLELGIPDCDPSHPGFCVWMDAILSGHCAIVLKTKDHVSVFWDDRVKLYPKI